MFQGRSPDPTFDATAAVGAPGRARERADRGEFGEWPPGESGGVLEAPGRPRQVVGRDPGDWASGVRCSAGTGIASRSGMSVFCLRWPDGAFCASLEWHSAWWMADWWGQGNSNQPSTMRNAPGSTDEGHVRPGMRHWRPVSALASRHAALAPVSGTGGWSPARHGVRPLRWSRCRNSFRSMRSGPPRPGSKA
jgi:hypothetical protein